MDFPQQIEEILTEKPAQFDVTMDPILDEKSQNTKFDPDTVLAALLNQHATNAIPTNIQANDLKNNAMSSSIGSILEDTTPSDSGVQLLDSESSELMIESISSQNGFEFDDKSTAVTTTGPTSGNLSVTSGINNQLPDLVLPAGEQSPKPLIAMTKSDFENSNVVEQKQPDITTNTTTEDIMTTSNCSTFDTENIVYRRRVKKPHAVTKQAPKKRVSFHEDILKNTRTDNIHIEHGFITYKNGRKAGVVPGRYSWCSEGDGEEFHNHQAENQAGQVVYRNACSDVLDYGNADIYENVESNYLQYDNSGVFEYHHQDKAQRKNANHEKRLYKCSCSSSNSSLEDSGGEDNGNKNGNPGKYTQAKSSSCDCIGMNNTNNNFIGENCYFSEPSIDYLNENNTRKSVWSKEKKPKTSCLKKTRRHTDIIQEHDLNNKMKKFNVHDVNNLIDNSKMIFGSLKSIFTIPLPERGVPEGSEDVQSVYECIPENEPVKPTSPMKPRPFLSKSLDGGLKTDQNNQKKKFVHNVDEQLRRKNEEDLYAPTRQNSDDEKQSDKGDKTPEAEITAPPADIVSDMSQFRNKFIINCESTVFEHTGVSYTYEAEPVDPNVVGVGEKATPVAESSQSMTSTFISAPIKQTFVNIFKSLTETATSPTVKKEDETMQFFPKKSGSGDGTPTKQQQLQGKQRRSSSNIMTASVDRQSICSDVTTSTNTTTNNCDLSDTPWQKVHANSSKLSPISQKQTANWAQNRHLPSPMKRRNGSGGTLATARYDRARMSPDLFNLYGTGRDSKNTLFSEEFDDILTITTDADKNESDIVILDYPESTPEKQDSAHSSTQNLLKPPKSSLINRFLRNVTQKKIIETSIRRNNFFADKIKNEQKLFAGNLYLKGVKPRNPELIEDLNAEIAMEIEMSGVNSPRRELVGAEAGMAGDISRFELGIGEISVEIFNGNCLHLLREENEVLLKVFKLYTGYSREGYMTPVLVFLTDRTLYVTDLVRNRLCNKFVLAYSELDVILMGPYGNTVLLSNSARDMQQVLLAGGPYPADGLVANLELCARRSGSTLPAVGQLTLEHLAPLQAFVCENSSVSRKDAWVYYAVVNVPAGALGSEQEPLGPHIKGFLMHRRLQETTVMRETWQPGYFLLKAGVLYMFNDSTQKLPTWAMALAECQGARRAVKTGRPHCFEILLKHEVLQLAAPDEYVASEWLQALVQTASGVRLFEMQEKHKTLGCTLVMTENHLITLREDFRAPLRRVNKSGDSSSLGKASPFKENVDPNTLDISSAMSSVVSTPTKNTHRSNSSLTSTPTKLSSQLSRSTTVTTLTTHTNTTQQGHHSQIHYSVENEKSFTSMSSIYGKNSGVEVLTSAAIEEMIAIRIPSHNDSWWCILEFSCQEVRENSDDLVIFFASSSEMQRFLRMLEQLWQAKNNDLFPVTILDEDDSLSEQCTNLYMDINRSWEPLLSAALGYPR